MPAVSEARPDRDPQESYQAVLDVLRFAFNEHTRQAANFGDGVRVLVGQLPVLSEHGAQEGDTSLRLILVQYLVGGNLRYDCSQHIAGPGGDDRAYTRGHYWTNFGNTEVRAHKPNEAATLVRWIEFAQFKFEETGTLDLSKLGVLAMRNMDGTDDSSERAAIRSARVWRWLNFFKRPS